MNNNIDNSMEHEPKGLFEGGISIEAVSAAAKAVMATPSGRSF